MQLNVTTDYAVRTVLYLATKKDYASSTEISKAMGIPHAYVLKLTKTLRDADIISEKRGAKGGFTLKADPDQLTLLDILLKFEKTMIINKCLEKDGHCSRCAQPYCNVRKLLVKVQAQVGAALSVKISDFL